MSFVESLRKIYFRGTGYSFTHMGRLFLRMFVGLMLSQFGIRQLISNSSPEAELMFLPFLSFGLAEWLVIVIEIICSLCIMIGFLTRYAIIPPFILMIVSSHQIIMNFGLHSSLGIYILSVPFLFLGILAFLLLVGPGKISIDYFYSLYLINRHKGSEEELEEV